MPARPPLRPTARAGSRSANTGVQGLLAEAVRHHQHGRLDKAARLYEKVLRLDPQQPDALHLLGLVLHGRGDGEAAALIRQAIARAGRNAAYRNSLGVVLLERGDAAEAADAFAAALARDPLYAEAANNLGNARQRLGDFVAAIEAYDQALAIRPDYPEAHCNRARALHRHGDAAGAIEGFREAIRLKPSYGRAHAYMADVLGESGDRNGAEGHYREAIRLGDADGDAAAGLAGLMERANRLEDALAVAEQALARAPTALRAGIVAARCLRRLGRTEEALRRLDGLGMARAVSELQAARAFEVGAACDRLGDFARAYAAFAEGNARMLMTPAAARANAGFFPGLIARLKARFTAEWLAAWTPAPAPEDEPSPIFLIGFPRSGTTLLDQILDAHPGLTSLEERDAIDVVRRTVDRLPGGYPDALATLSGEQVQGLRRLYRDEVARHLGGAPAGRIVDKMPLNTIDAGLIHRLFPDSPLILALRHPCDVILSGFIQAFQPNDAMIHFASLDSTARFYAAVMDLWRHYRAVLPLTVVTVRYEDLTADLEGEARRVLAGLQVPWDDRVLAYAEHAKSRAIATPSYHQVVQPIYRRSVGRWHNYAGPMAEVLPVLQPYIEAFGYEADV